MAAKPAKRPGRPPKSAEALRRDRARQQLAITDIWLMVRSRQLASPKTSISQVCEFIVSEATAASGGSPKRIREMLGANQKYLFDAGTLRRLYYRADALVRNDAGVREFCERELRRWGPWRRPQN